MDLPVLLAVASPDSGCIKVKYYFQGRIKSWVFLRLGKFLCEVHEMADEVVTPQEPLGALYVATNSTRANGIRRTLIAAHRISAIY